jgi:hypothetical protein
MSNYIPIHYDLQGSGNESPHAIIANGKHHVIIPKDLFLEGSLRKHQNMILGKLKPEYQHLEGEGLFDFLKDKFNAVKDYLKPRNDSYNNKSRSTLEQYGNEPIESIELVRTPIKSMLNSALNFISLGRWDQLKQKYSFDKLFHLGLVAKLKNKNIVVEKNEVINISTNYNVDSDSEVMRIATPQGLTLNSMLDKTKERIGNDNFFLYDAFGSRNCQNFIKDILEANGLLTAENKAWLFQDVSELAKELPGYVPQVAKALTDVAATANKIVGGDAEGFNEMVESLGLPEATGTKQTGDNSFKVATNADDVIKFDEAKYKQLMKKALTKEQYDSRPHLQPYNDYIKSFEQIQRDRATTNVSVADRLSQDKNLVAFKNELFNEYVKMNPELETVKCDLDENGDVVPGGVMVPAYQCKQNHLTRKRKQLESQPLGAVVKGLTTVADKLADLPLPGIASAASEIYKTFAPPTSKYYGGGIEDDEQFKLMLYLSYLMHKAGR